MLQEVLKKKQRAERFGLPPSKEELAKIEADKRAAVAKDLDEKKKVCILGGCPYLLLDLIHAHNHGGFALAHMLPMSAGASRTVWDSEDGGGASS